MLKGVLLVGVALFLLATSIPLDKKLDSKNEKFIKEEVLETKEVKRQNPCTPKCANPKGFAGCGNCKHSQCMLKGCVHYGAHGVSWKPDNCTTCHCSSRNERVCLRETCFTLNCYGYPKVKRPGKCCEECDFGAAKNECKLIPVGLKNVSLGADHNTCKQALVHDCNIDFVLNGGKWQRCMAATGMSKVSDNSGCEGITGQYENKISCSQIDISDDMMPMDYDDDPLSCQVYVH